MDIFGSTNAAPMITAQMVGGGYGGFPQGGPMGGDHMSLAPSAAAIAQMVQSGQFNPGGPVQMPSMPQMPSMAGQVPVFSRQPIYPAAQQMQPQYAPMLQPQFAPMPYYAAPQGYAPQGYMPQYAPPAPAPAPAALSKGAGEGLLTEEELKKSLEGLKTIYASQPMTRKAELLSKAGAGTLAAGEVEELYKACGGAAHAAPRTSVVEDLTKSLDAAGNPAIQEAFNATNYVQALHNGLVKSLEAAGSAINDQGARQHEMNVVLAKGLADALGLIQQQGSLVKSLEAKLDDWGRQPAYAPRAFSGAPGQMPGPQAYGMAGQPMQKSFYDGSGYGPGEQPLSKAELGEALMYMQQHTQGHLSKSGHDYQNAISMLETSGYIDPNLYSEVAAFRAHAGQR